MQSEFGGSVHPHLPTEAELALAETALAAAPEAAIYARVDLVNIEGKPAIMGLELIEPFLFLSTSKDALDRFVKAHIPLL